MVVDSAGLGLLGTRYQGFCKKSYDNDCQNVINGRQVTVIVRIVPIVDRG